MDYVPCKDGNEEQWVGLNSMWAVAKAQEAEGDPFHFSKAFMWVVGNYPYRCFPERFIAPRTQEEILEEVQEKALEEVEEDAEDPR